MRAKCKCGHVFEVGPEKQGTITKCPDCGQLLRLPASAGSAKLPEPPALPPLPKAGKQEQEKGFDFGIKFDFEEEEKKPTEAPGKQEAKAEGFDWRDFKLEGEEEKPPSAPKPTSPAQQPEPAEQPSDELDLILDERGGEKTEAKAADDVVIDLGPGHILGVRRSSEAAAPPSAPRVRPAAPTAGAPAPAEPTGEMKICRGCGKVISEAVASCPECGTPLAERMRASGEPPVKRGEPFAGSFLRAYPTVMAGGGRKAWLVCAQAGAIMPALLLLLTRVIGGLFGSSVWTVMVPLISVITLVGIIGSVCLYMAHAASNGTLPIAEGARPLPKDDLIMPAFMVLVSWSVLGIAPVVAGGILSVSTHAVSLEAVSKDLSLALDASGKLKAIAPVLKSGFLIAGLLFALLCFPMVVMVLGVSQKMIKALNPVNVFMAVFKSPLEYLALAAFFICNSLIAPVLVVLFLTATATGAGAPAGTSVGYFARMVGLFGPTLVIFLIMAVGVYLGAVSGWRMGVFVHDNPKVFDHLR